MQVTTIGLDIAKNVFQVHAIDTAEKVVVRKQLRRSQVLEFFKALPACLIGMEACATAHYWARELTKLGHQVRLMPAKDVKAYVKRNKNDAADAEAICEAVRRPTMRFVQVKSAEQQGRLMLHRTRDLLMRQRTQLINALRAHLAELGIVAAQGNAGLKELLKIIAGERDARLTGPFPSNGVFEVGKAVVLPPGQARLSTYPAPTGSATVVNTIGKVWDAFCSGVTAALELARITSGESATNFSVYWRRPWPKHRRWIAISRSKRSASAKRRRSPPRG